MCLADIITCTAILDGGPAIGKADLLGRLLTLLADAGHVSHADVPVLQDVVMRRERLGSTGIGKGLAIPHARHLAVSRPLGVLAVCRPPVAFESLDGEPVDLVALCLFPPARPGQHLGEASRGSEVLSRRLRDDEFCGRLRRAESAEEIGEIVGAEGGMTQREWMACTDTAAMLRLLRDRAVIDARKARLFGSACCRRHWDLLPDEGRTAVEVAERFADGLIDRDELDAARKAFLAVAGAEAGVVSFAEAAISYLLGEARHDPLRYAADILPWAAQASGDQAEERAAQTGILRCLFGPPPFETVAIRPEWLAFGDGVVAKLARGIFAERAFDRTPILADALLDAGCGDEDMLGHLRGPGPHARGCHVLDRLLEAAAG